MYFFLIAPSLPTNICRLALAVLLGGSQRIASNAFRDSSCGPLETQEKNQIQPVIHAGRVLQVVIVHCELFQRLGEYVAVAGDILREAARSFHLVPQHQSGIKCNFSQQHLG
jgi:hypothetical protein